MRIGVDEDWSVKGVAVGAVLQAHGASPLGRKPTFVVFNKASVCVETVHGIKRIHPAFQWTAFQWTGGRMAHLVHIH